ncbi:ubiquitin-conjugating enzyme E2 U isoform X2 [Pseudophryne corroboree]|uniref:ubiquitin-conjugating enzyme E2 U isoform X2 n=1 Tax=Pseudophryne corroboree TaxID=495146 RepID=UPI00308128F0
MHSRTYLLLEREYQELQEARLYGISVMPATDNYLQWIAKVQGLKDSLWEGAVLQLNMTYTEEYNYHPPSIIFNTIPFHPNVDQITGKPCIDFLDNPAAWNPHFTMSYILLVIQSMLSNPVTEKAINLEAADMLMNNPALYRRVIVDCVKISRQIEAGSAQDCTTSPRTPTPDSAPVQRRIKPVSFEDYHRNWSEIATSKSTQDLRAKRLKEPEPRALYREDDEIRNGNRLRNIVFYGLVGNNTRTIPTKHVERKDDAGSCVLCRLSESFSLEYADHIAHTEPDPEKGSYYHTEPVTSYRGSTCGGEPQEEEVDNLVSWADTLSAELLED